MATRFLLPIRGFLKLAGLLEEPQQKYSSQKFARPVTVGLTFVLPAVSSSTSASSKHFWLRHCFNMINLTLHLGLVGLLGFFGLYLGSLLMACMAILDILQVVLRHATSAIFSLPRMMDGDALPMSAKGSIDVHVIAQTTNASHMDVLVGVFHPTTCLDEYWNPTFQASTHKMGCSYYRGHTCGSSSRTYLS